MVDLLDPDHRGLAQPVLLQRRMSTELPQTISMGKVCPPFQMPASNSKASSTPPLVASHLLEARLKYNNA